VSSSAKRDSDPQTKPSAEKWVDLRVVAEHIGFSYQTTRRLAIAGEIPAKPFELGKKTYWRCLLSEIDEAMKNSKAR
jgi:hypothetical protein